MTLTAGGAGAAQVTLCDETPDLSTSHVDALPSGRQGKLKGALSVSWAAFVTQAFPAWWLKRDASLSCRELWRALCAQPIVAGESHLVCW